LDSGAKAIKAQGKGEFGKGSLQKQLRPRKKVNLGRDV